MRRAGGNGIGVNDRFTISFGLGEIAVVSTYSKTCRQFRVWTVAGFSKGQRRRTPAGWL